MGTCTNPQDYVSRTNTEFAKVTARGITLLAASGDTGAPGDNHPNCGGLSDLFPASSPWVLAVGATMLGTAPGNAAWDPQASPVTAPVCHKQGSSCARGDVLTEEVCTYPTALITSGGGFSQYTPVRGGRGWGWEASSHILPFLLQRPAYQNAAVSKYLSSGVALPPSSMFNSANRAFPDVAALGHNYLVYLQGQITPVDGTRYLLPLARMHVLT